MHLLNPLSVLRFRIVASDSSRDANTVTATITVGNEPDGVAFASNGVMHTLHITLMVQSQL